MTRVKLSRSYAGHGPAVAEAVVREPTGGLYFDLGEPFEVQRTTGGEPLVIENREVIRAYVEACVGFPGVDDPVVILHQLSVVDARAVREAVLDFFAVAKGSNASSPSSSATADGAPPISSD